MIARITGRIFHGLSIRDQRDELFRILKEISNATEGYVRLLSHNDADKRDKNKVLDELLGELQECANLQSDIETLGELSKV